VAYVAGGANYHTWLPSRLLRRLRDSVRYSRRLRSVITLTLLSAFKPAREFMSSFLRPYDLCVQMLELLLKVGQVLMLQYQCLSIADTMGTMWQYLLLVHDMTE